MSNIFQNDENLNSPIIIKDIDCSIPCNILFYFCSCCPTKIINFFPPTSSDFIEILMISLSLTPYPVVFLLLCLAAYFRTSRSILLLALVFIENFIVVFLKMIIQEPRPNYLCNYEYGFPSNHSCFFTCILFWFILEELYTPKILQFKYKSVLILFGIIYPFILYSRYYLNYHSIGQIFGGFIFGIFFAIVWFFFSIKYILVSENIIKTIMINLNIENNMTFDILFQSDGYILLDNFQNLIQKEAELRDMKNKLEKMNKNLNVMDNIKEFNDKFQDIIEDNDGKINNNIYDDNNIDNNATKDDKLKNN